MLLAFFPKNTLPVRTREVSSLHESVLLRKKARQVHLASNKLRFEASRLCVCESPPAAAAWVGVEPELSRLDVADDGDLS